MQILSKRTLREFWQRHLDSKEVLDDWYRETRQARWTTPVDVRSRHAAASILSHNRVVFRLRGNAYRLVVRIDYAHGMVFIRFVGTHAQYDRINALEV